jgi:hypothetical protein
MIRFHVSIIPSGDPHQCLISERQVTDIQETRD